METVSNEGKGTWIKNKLWVTVALEILVLGLAIVLTHADGLLGWDRLLVGLVFVGGIFIFVTWSTDRQVRGEIRDLSRRLETKVVTCLVPGQIKWLYNHEQLADYEKHCSATEIWIITTDLTPDCVTGPFHEAVVANLNRGIKYVFFVPERKKEITNDETINKIDTNILHMKNTHNDHKNLQFKRVNRDYFSFVPRLDFVIYDPNKDGRVAYIGIPVHGGLGGFHAKVDNGLADTIVGLLLNELDPKNIKEVVREGRNEKEVVSDNTNEKKLVRDKKKKKKHR